MLATRSSAIGPTAPPIVDAPQVPVDYGVNVRCSSAPSCQGLADSVSSASTHVAVPCPATGNARARFYQGILVNKGSIGGAEPDANVTVSWSVPGQVDGVRGDLIALRTNLGNYAGTVQGCLGNNVNGNNLPADPTLPAAGGGIYYLVRPAITTLCNEVGVSYDTGHPKEVPGVGGDRDADIGNLAPSCP